ncbi:MAG: hypothetical protein V1827_03070 [Candidatus Micrarchaeota archaeon]
MSEYFVVEPCQSAGGFEIRLSGKKIDIKKAESALSKVGEVAGSSPVVLLAKIKGLSLSVYGSGRMMVKGKLKAAEAQAFAEKIVSALENGGALI